MRRLLHSTHSDKLRWHQTSLEKRDTRASVTQSRPRQGRSPFSSPDTHTAPHIWMLPDDLARVVVDKVAADSTVRTAQVLDSEAGEDVTSWCIEVIKSTSTRALACVNRQYARLVGPAMRTIGRRAYRASNHGPEHVVFLEIK